MPVTAEFDPRDEGVIDAFTSAIYEMEPFNHYANGYAMQVLHHYFGDFDDEWYTNWVATEEFRGQRFPGGVPMSDKQLHRYEQMYDLYWDARAEWFSVMIANLNMKNVLEGTRMSYGATLWNDTLWKDHGRNAQGRHITHLMSEEQVEDFFGDEPVGSPHD